MELLLRQTQIYALRKCWLFCQQKHSRACTQRQMPHDSGIRRRKKTNGSKSRNSELSRQNSPRARRCELVITTSRFVGKFVEEEDKTLHVASCGFVAATDGQISFPGIHSGDLDFLLNRCISTVKWRLRDIFDEALPCDLYICPFDLNSVSYTLYSASHTDLRINFDHPTIIRSWVMHDDWIWSHYRHLERSLRMRRVTWPITGGIMIHFFETPDHNLPIDFVTFRAATSKIKPCYGRKIAQCACGKPCVVSRITWPLHKGSLKTRRNNFYHELSVHYTIFMARWRLRELL